MIYHQFVLKTTKFELWFQVVRFLILGIHETDNNDNNNDDDNDDNNNNK